MTLLQKFRSLTSRLDEKKNEKKLQAIAKEIAAFVDDEFYLNANPDVLQSGMSPALHYAQFGWREGRDPSPGFSTADYCARHPELLENDDNPLAHFARTAPEPDSASPVSDEEIAIVTKAFDTAYYLRKYGDQIPSDSDAIVHYCTKGWRAGLDPNRAFSTSHYLTTYSDVKDSGVNPFWHFLVAGRAEGRTAKAPRSWQLDAASSLQPLEDAKQSWLKSEDGLDLLSPADLQDLLVPKLTGEPVLLSIGHDDYRKVPGGVQLCIGHEETLARSYGIRHLNLHPWQGLPTLAAPGSDPVLCLTLDGTACGQARMSDITARLAQLDGCDFNLVCHHLIGHSPEGIIDMAKAIGTRQCTFWLHDYFSICTSHTLMRNNLAACGAPAASSNACQLCRFGAERRKQTARIQAFFDALEVDLLSPSQVALDLWLDKSGLTPRSAKVVPHATLTPSAPLPAQQDLPARYRIAFIGNPSPHKGWPVFKELMETAADNPAFEFWVFNANPTEHPEYTHQTTHAHSDDPLATMTALQEAQIDIVLHWAEWAETYSFSTVEAIAAGAFVITNQGAGNVPKLITEHDTGCVLEAEQDVYDLVQNGGLQALAEAARARRAAQSYRLAFSTMSLTDLTEKARAA